MATRFGPLLLLLAAAGVGLAAAAAATATPSDRLLRLRIRHRQHAPHIPLDAPGYAAAAAAMAQCQELYMEQRVDHFAYHKERSLEGRTFRQRYFLCGKDWWRGPGAPIFFYCGNEADVTLYLNASGLMWENAQDFGALLVFAEHRYVSMCICGYGCQVP